MSDLFSKVKLIMDELDIQYSEQNYNCFTFFIPVKECILKGWLFCDSKDDLILYDTSCEILVPEDSLSTVMEYFTRANYNMTMGAFQLDLDDGAVFYRVYHRMRNCEPTNDLITELIGYGNSAFDYYFPCMMHIIYGKKSALEAKEYVHKKWAERSSEEVS